MVSMIDYAYKMCMEPTFYPLSMRTLGDTT